MITLAPNTSGQRFFTTAYQGRILLDESFTDYLILFYQSMGDNTYAFVGNVDIDNNRYTSFDIDTDTDDPTAGNVEIPESINGYFHYIIYGQNSSTNLDPLDASVVGEVERGLAHITNPATLWNSDNVGTPTFKVYAG